MNILKNKKGVSLPLVTGLVTVLMVASVAANELIVRTFRTVQGVEASNKAYFAAEAGIEDALYELSPHLAGYQTPLLNDINDDDIRQDTFNQNGGPRWDNRWAIESQNKNQNWSDKFFANQKLMTYLYTDTDYKTKNEIGITGVNDGINAINPEGPAVTSLDVSSFLNITFNIPKGIIPEGDPTLVIDNDEDMGNSIANNGINEDAPGDENQGCLQNPEDKDCDGKIDEDSPEDPIILWKLTDGTAHTLIPVKGCLTNIAPLPIGTQICEKDFNDTINLTSGTDFSVTLTEAVEGQNELGETKTIGGFISEVLADNPTAKLHFEFLIVAPMEYVSGNEKIKIPYIEYTIDTNDDSKIIPYPYFKIKSDGYYGAYKQSITTTLMPKTTVPLFDFTIIQQQ